MSQENSERTHLWDPTPFSVLRDDLVAGIISKLPKGSFLEIGVGPGGGMIPTLASYDHFGLGIDIAKDVVEHAIKYIPDCHHNILIALISPKELSLAELHPWKKQNGGFFLMI